MKRILCYGDSNTWGHNPKDASRFRENERLTKLLQQKLGDEYEIIEEGLCGRTASFYDSVKPFRHGISSLRMVLDSAQPIDLVIIMLGTNDLKSCYNGDGVSISNGIREMVHIIKNPYVYNAHFQIPDILIVAPILLKDELSNNLRTSEQFNEKSLQTSRKLASFYEIVAKQWDCLFLNAADYAEASSIDCLHMDANNHKKLAEAIYQKLKEW